MKTASKPHKYSVTIYLLLANGITWLCWIPSLIISAQQGYMIPNFDTYASLFKTGFANSQHMLLSITFSLGVFGPLIGGLVATWMDGGKEGLADLWWRITKWQISGRWYLTAFVITFLLAGLPVAIFALSCGFMPSVFSLSYVVFAFAVQIFTSGLGEEPGWRGFLLPRLRARFTGGDKFVWILGFIWAIWHYPLMIIQGFSGIPDITMLQALIMQILNLAGFTMSIIGITFIYAWLYNQTKSIFLMIVFHALSNLFSYWFPTFLAEPQAITILVALMPWVVVLFLEKRLGKKNFPG